MTLVSLSHVDVLTCYRSPLYRKSSSPKRENAPDFGITIEGGNTSRGASQCPSLNICVRSYYGPCEHCISQYMVTISYCQASMYSVEKDVEEMQT